jgi:thiol-disulfide isomerase/thioredoxin
MRSAPIPFAVTILALAATSCNGSGQGGGLGSSSNLTAFTAVDLEGKVFDLGAHLGKDVVLMSFWATWCEPCKAEMPTLEALHQKYREQGLSVLSVSIDRADTVAGVRPHIRANRYSFPVVIDEDSSIAQAYNPRSVAPFTVLIGRDAKIAKTIEGFQLSEVALLEAEVRQLLGPE